MNEIELDPRIIYDYDTHRNIPWNIVEYQPVREYLDPALEMKKRDGSAHPVVDKSNAKRQTFFDDYVKIFKDLPEPGKYTSQSGFDQTRNRQESRKHKISFKLRKNSYLDQIELKAKRIKSPAVGQYHLESTSPHTKSHKKHRKIDDKRFFYQDAQFLSTAVPGSACYYPHDEVPNIKTDRTTYQTWIKKHSAEKLRDKKRRLKQPDPGTYRPLSASFNSFDKIKVNDQKQKKKIGKKQPLQGFGSSDSKFTYNRQKKGKQDVKPDPCNYNTMIQWKGKGLDSKKNNWVRCLSAGPTRSIYH